MIGPTSGSVDSRDTCTVGVLQPGYLPWLGFFDQMRRCTTFVLYDDVPYDKGGWRNRNRIKCPSGSQWLTVPVRTRHRFGQSILDVEIDNSGAWARSHRQSIQQHYARAPYLASYLPELAELLSKEWEHLVDLDVAVINLMSGWLGLHRQIVRSSELGLRGSKTERLVNICRHFGATRYLTGDAARSYLDTARFAERGITVVWQEYRHPVYPQLHGGFMPYLSALDLILNCGDQAMTYLGAG
jgi:hypothetical protein